MRIRSSMNARPRGLQRFRTGLENPHGEAVRRDAPYTNNGSERALRPSVIFRKVTGGFRSHWGARLYAAAVSVIATGRLRGKSALQAIQGVIAPPPALKPA